MTKHPYGYTIEIWFCGGPEDKGEEALAFVDLLQQKWPDSGRDLSLDHWGVGNVLPGDRQNWKLTIGDALSFTQQDPEEMILSLLGTLKPTQEVRVEIKSKWNYR